jgi:hypothetical protein
MYERTYGYRYDAHRTVAQDAKLIRADIKMLVKAAMLPTDWTYSVRSTHSSIRITATSPRPTYAADPRQWEPQWNPESEKWVHAWVDKLTLEARAVHDALNELHHAYNHDGSDIQSDYFDVKYYGTAGLETAPGVAQYVATATEV